MHQPTPCLCGCKRLACWRGRSIACLTRMRRDIAAGKTTEAAEIAAGRLLESGRRGVLGRLRDREHRRIRGGG